MPRDKKKKLEYDRKYGLTRREFRKKFGETIPEEYNRRNRYYKHEFGITVDDYEDMLKRQKGVCNICGRPPKTRRLAVDHNHKTGKVRGLLCGICNRKVVGIIERLNIDVRKIQAHLCEIGLS